MTEAVINEPDRDPSWMWYMEWFDLDETNEKNIKSNDSNLNKILNLFNSSNINTYGSKYTDNAFDKKLVGEFTPLLYLAFVKSPPERIAKQLLLKFIEYRYEFSFG